MEYVPPPDLIWTVESFSDCLVCDGRVQAEEVDLAIESAEPADADEYRAVLGRCPQCGRWYGVFDMLDEIIAHEGWSGYEAVHGFRVNDEAHEAGVWFRQVSALLAWEDFCAQQARAREAEEAPLPTPEEVRALEATPAPWEIAVAPSGWVGEDPAAARLVYLALAVSSEGLVRGNSLHEGAPPDAEALAALVLRAAAHPASDAGGPARPPEVRLDDAGPAGPQAAALAERLDPAGIAVRAAPTERASEVIRQLAAHLSQHGEGPYFAEYDEDEIRAFFDAARAFYQAAPWRRIAPQKYLAFRLDGGPWQFMNVMGQMEEEPGLSLFDDFLHLCRFLHNAPRSPGGLLGEVFGEFIEELTDEGPMDQLRASGALEGITLSPLPLLHPQDGARLLDLGIEPMGGEYPAPHRYSGEAVHEAPRRPLSAYRALLDAVREAVARRRADPITSIKETFTTTGEHAVDLRYPSKGEEIVPPDPGGVKLTAYAPETDEALLHVRAPGAATLYEVARAVQQERAGLYPAAFGDGKGVFWENGVQRGQPMPYVFQLLALEDLWMEEGWEDCPVEAEPLAAGNVPEDVEVDVLP